MKSENISQDEKSKINKSKFDFDNLKSDYFLIRIFDIMKKNKTLEILKYNKKLQKRLNLNINDYKKYSQIYSSIELELKTNEYIYGRFINIFDEEKQYYRIYFNNSKKEISRNYLKYKEKVETIKIIINYQVKSFIELFLDCKCISSIYFKKFYRNNITDMNWMFSKCTLLKEIDSTNFNTNNVTNMSGMFYECSSLKELNLNNFNTNNVTNMAWMFCKCSSLEELNLSNFNTNNVENMYCMFHKCSSLKKLNVSNFNFHNVTDMVNMFFGCSLLKELNISNYINNNKADMNGMFDGCSDELKKKIEEIYD